MDDLVIGVGQWSEPATSGAATTASAYAGYGEVHLAAVADGAAGPVPSRVAAQAAVSSLTASFRATAGKASTQERLETAFAEAHQAVRRAALGSHAEGRAGASLAAAVIERDTITFGRIGGGRLHALRSETAVAFSGRTPAGYVGDGITPPDVTTHALRLETGDRVVLATDPTARTIAADLSALARGGSPQIMAQSLVGAARRRGESGALVLQVLEVRSQSVERDAHPALSRLAQPEVPTYDVDGRRVHGFARRPAPTGPAALATIVLVLGVATGGVAAWMAGPATDGVRHPTGLASTAAPTTAPRDPPDGSDGAALDALPAEAAAADTGLEGPAEPPAPRSADDARVEGLFMTGEPNEAARALKRHLERSRRQTGGSALVAVDRWVAGHADARVVRVLVELIQLRPRDPIRRWAADLVADLYGRAAKDGLSAPPAMR